MLVKGRYFFFLNGLIDYNGSWFSIFFSSNLFSGHLSNYGEGMLIRRHTPV